MLAKKRTKVMSTKFSDFETFVLPQSKAVKTTDRSKFYCSTYEVRKKRDAPAN